MTQHWLADQANQAEFYDLAYQAVQLLAHHETPLFAEIFPEYVHYALAEQDIDHHRPTARPFSLSGAEDLLTLVIIPVLSMTLGALLVKRGVERLSTLRQRTDESQAESPLAIDEINQQLESSLRQYGSATPESKRLQTALAKFLAQFLAL